MASTSKKNTLLLADQYATLHATNQNLKQTLHFNKMRGWLYMGIFLLIAVAIADIVVSVKERYGFIIDRVTRVQAKKGATNSDPQGNGTGPDHVGTTMTQSPLYLAMCFDYPFLSISFANKNFPQAVLYMYSNKNAVKRVLPMMPHCNENGFDCAAADPKITMPKQCAMYPAFYVTAKNQCPDFEQGPLFHYSEERYFEAVYQKSLTCGGYDPNNSVGNKNCSAQYMVCSAIFSYCDTASNMATLLDSTDDINVIGNLYFSRMIQGCGTTTTYASDPIAAIKAIKGYNKTKAEHCQQLYAYMTTGKASSGSPTAGPLGLPEQRNSNSGYAFDTCFFDTQACHPPCSALAYNNMSRADRTSVRKAMTSGAAGLGMTGSAVGGAVGSLIPIPGASVLGSMLGGLFGAMAGASRAKRQAEGKVQTLEREANCTHARANCQMQCSLGFCPKCSAWYPQHYQDPGKYMQHFAIF